MASQSTTRHLSDEVNCKMVAILTRLSFVASGTPESDRAAELLRELSGVLNDFDLRSVAIRNDAAARRG